MNTTVSTILLSLMINFATAALAADAEDRANNPDVVQQNGAEPGEICKRFPNLPGCNFSEFDPTSLERIAVE